jgi:3-isopropylmalate dehydrogenase
MKRKFAVATGVALVAALSLAACGGTPTEEPAADGPITLTLSGWSLATTPEFQVLADGFSKKYPDVTVDYQHVDAVTIHMVRDPARFDVIVTDNLLGDIITDLAGAISGGIGLAASGNINPDGTFPSMFEPVHGSAPDIAGQRKADPTAAILSTALLLDHLGLPEAARRVEAAVTADLAARGSTARSTDEVGSAILARLGAD